MTTARLRLALAACAVIACGAGAWAAKATLAVKPGLWQITVRGQIMGTISIPAEKLRAMSQDDREEYEARLAASAAAAAEGHTFKNCVSIEQLRRGFIVDNRRSNNCTRTVVASTVASMIVRMECKERDHTTVGMVRFQAIDTQNVRGTTDMAVTTAGKTMTVHSTTSAKWLGADCKGLKPGQVKAN